MIVNMLWNMGLREDGVVIGKETRIVFVSELACDQQIDFWQMQTYFG
jgi:hypothetical protein